MTGAAVPEARAPLLEVRDLQVAYPRRGGLLGRTTGWTTAVRGVDLDLYAGETLGLVGESGCGKSSLARALLRLVEPAGGSVRYRGADVGAMDRRALRAYRRRVQIVFQDPAGALNPRMTAGATVAEALHAHGLASGRVGERTSELMDMVGLGAEHLDRYPHALSGGQRQRLCLARALAVEPEILVLDEALSALDVSIRAQIANLLQDLQERLGLGYLCIAHDLGLVEHLSDRVAVMYLGRVVEVAARADLYHDPWHPYTRALLRAVPGAALGAGGGGDRPAGWRTLSGEPPDPAAPPPGCAFHPRCPHPARDEECRGSSPPLRTSGNGRSCACFKAPGGA